MNLIGLSSPGRGELWAWTGTDKFGKSRDYQTHGPDTTELGMLRHLRHYFPGLVISNLRRIKSGEFKPYDPALGEVESHAFMHGHRDWFREHVKTMPADERRSLVQTAMNLRPIHLSDKYGSIDDPLRSAVIVALRDIESERIAAEAKQAQPRPTIREQRRPILTLRNSIRH